MTKQHIAAENVQNGKVFACINKYKYGELNLKCPVIQCFSKFGGIRAR